MSKPEFICNDCKSHSISGLPTSVYWNTDTGRWEVSDGADIEDLQCIDCESDDIRALTNAERAALPEPVNAHDEAVRLLRAALFGCNQRPNFNLRAPPEVGIKDSYALAAAIDKYLGSLSS